MIFFYEKLWVACTEYKKCPLNRMDRPRGSPLLDINLDNYGRVKIIQIISMEI